MVFPTPDDAARTSGTGTGVMPGCGRLVGVCALAVPSCDRTVSAPLVVVVSLRPSNHKYELTIQV
jgi:hypothetical protein